MNDIKQADKACRTFGTSQNGVGTALLTLHNVSVSEALARFGGDEERYRHWLLEFIGHGPNAAAQIRQAITSGSCDAAVKLTHALKGRTGMLGMNELHSISQTLELALRNGDPPQMWLEELEIAVEEMSQQIQTAFGEPAI